MILQLIVLLAVIVLMNPIIFRQKTFWMTLCLCVITSGIAHYFNEPSIVVKAYQSIAGPKSIPPGCGYIAKQLSGVFW